MKNLIIVCILFIVHSTLKAQVKEVCSINCKQFYELSQKAENVLIVDIRESKYYKKGHLNKAVYGGKKEILKPILDKTPKDTPIFIYCEVGKRSKQAGEWILKQGYQTVYQLSGGVKNWDTKTYPFIKE
ncbi:rhodanese-like domain-containing protein [Saccharicrinis aurantiacus]|uniref:rhodanese-like domain-containing protein n=1 Tax=Saccharicrinis aurantiacus TaxID=1849719 RepID=UPI002491F035|nr:rhodanese-like domain-containing protein [Saccharicrinis aurantiacus]